jgi:hypothetical protein
MPVIGTHVTQSNIRTKEYRGEGMFYAIKSTAEMVYDEHCEANDHFGKLVNVDDKDKLFQSGNVAEVRAYIDPCLIRSELGCRALYLCNEDDCVVEVFPLKNLQADQESGWLGMPPFLVGILYMALLNSSLMFFHETSYINPFALGAAMISVYCVIVLLKIQNIIEGAIICTMLSALLWFSG